ncbi:unnamed protein product [Paramecium primaurelia]|uniref:Uncharacterized protein n=1 Tax=Paramecium primaurelia TaxID=5886 RepID=A0A8S1PU79_PARPR|nr:unnamed protein product [Paramecium primaurelia]
MPAEIARGKKYQQQHINNDLPTKDELFNQLGIMPDDDSVRVNDHKGDHLRISKQLIQEKQEQLNYLPPKPPTPLVIKQKVSNQRLTSQELEKMLEEHRQQMRPIAEQYEQMRLSDVRSKSYNPKSQRSKSPKVKVTYHEEPINIDKLRRSQKDIEGPHGDFLKGVLPKQKLQKFKSESKLISDDDFQKKFKNYLRNKRKHDSSRNSSQEKLEFDLYQSTSPNRGRWNQKHINKAVFKDRSVLGNDSSLSKSKSKSKSKKDKKKDQSMSEQQLCEQIFKQIDNKQVGLIDKIQTIKYLISNPEIMEAFNINPKDLNQQVNKFPTKQQGVFTQNEFTRFLQKYKSQYDHEAFGGLSHVSQQQQVSSCLLNEDQIQILKNIFDTLQNDMIAQRKELIQAFRNDIQVVRMLHVQAAYVSAIDKILNLETILSQLEAQAFEFPYISWKQFMDAFEYDAMVSKQQLSFATLKESQKQVDDQDRIDAPEELQQLIKEQFNKIVMDDYVTAFDLIECIRRAPLYSQLRKQIIRKQSKKSDIKEETLEQILKRIEETAEEYLTFQEFMSYFTRRGQPKFNEEVASLARSVNVTEALQNNENRIDGYDSDPELHTYQDKMLPRERLIKKHPSQQALLTYSHRKKSLPSKTPITKEDFLSAIQPKPQYGAHSKPSDYQFKVTQPQPFNFDKREKERSLSIRERKLQEMLDEKKRNNSFKSFKAKEIPQIVKQDGLYEKIINDNEKRREEVKKNSVQMTLKNERPFSFYRRDQNSSKKPRKKYWEEREKFVFKAKAIPWHVHVELLRQMEQDEETKRKERIAKHAQELAMSSRMPPRMEMHERQKQGQPQSPKYMKTQISYKAKPIPDFDKLHSSFQDQLNRKKLQMRTTEPEPFNFQQSHKGVDRPYLDRENETKINTVKEDKIEEARKKMSIKPARQPPSTKKWESNCEFLKKERIKKAEKQEQIKKEEQERLARKEKFKQRVQQSEAIQDNSKKLEQQRKDRIAQLKKESKEQEMKQKQIIENCKRKATEQPLLVERPTKRDVQLEKMKQLNKIDKMLKQNGVMNRDEYFNKEEKAMLDDIHYLKKHGYEDDFEKE